MKVRVLLADDDLSLGPIVRARLGEGFEVTWPQFGPVPRTADEYVRILLETLERTKPDVVLLDVMYRITESNALEEALGLRMLQRLKETEAWRRIPVVLYTAHETELAGVEFAESAKLAEQSLSKAAGNPEAHFAYLADVLRAAAAEKENEFGLRFVVGSSPAMRTLAKDVLALASRPVTVLLQGETGTGKEWVARALHDLGNRRDGPFYAINCAGLSETLQEAQLFGHLRGAYTGAERDSLGAFTEASGYQLEAPVKAPRYVCRVGAPTEEIGKTLTESPPRSLRVGPGLGKMPGTLFLDEVGELLPSTQAKLLRVLQARPTGQDFSWLPLRGNVRSIRPLGANFELPVDVRVIAATHTDLRGAVAEGRFREDLFYRLSVVELYVPPLRERKADIPRLAAYIISELRTDFDLHLSSTLSRSTLDALVAYDWPGNVRELRNCLERAAGRLAPGEASLDLTLSIPNPALDLAQRAAESAATRALAGDYSWEELRRDFPDTSRRRLVLKKIILGTMRDVTRMVEVLKLRGHGSQDNRLRQILSSHRLRLTDPVDIPDPDDLVERVLQGEDGMDWQAVQQLYPEPGGRGPSKDRARFLHSLSRACEREGRDAAALLRISADQLAELLARYAARSTEEGQTGSDAP